MALAEVLYRDVGAKAISRAQQLAQARAANANRMAARLRQRQAGGIGGGLTQYYSSPAYARQAAARRKPPPRKPPKPKAPKVSRDPTDLLGLGLFDEPLSSGPARQGGGDRPFMQDFMDDLDGDGRGTVGVRATDPKTGKPTALLPGRNQVPMAGEWLGVDRSEIDRFAKMNPEQQKQVRENVDNLRGDDSKYMKTVRKMLDDIKKDPLQDSARFLAGQELADAFRDTSKSRYFTNDDLIDNPLLATLNDLSIWSTYRLKVSDWYKNKKKSGDAVLEDDPGDGTFSGIMDNGSFSSVTSPSNLSPYLVTRDENGLLQIVTADQWIQAKYAQMRNDPEFAADMITALAVTSAYGSDSTANSQRSRLVVDKDGNPVKGFPSKEDFTALKWLANEVAILQNQGDEVAIDDSIAELTKVAFNVTEGAEAAGDFGGGGGYGYGAGGGWGGGGGYGGGGGGEGAVRYTDATQLTSMVSSIARQRMGRELTPEEAALFVQHYHGLEEQSSAAYYAGQSNTMLDPEGQAVAWITGHFAEDAATNTYGQLAADFFAMMGGSNPFGGISG